MAETKANDRADAPRFEGDRIHDNHQQPGSLTEGSMPANPPAGRDDTVVDAEFSGLDNDLIDMGQFGGNPETNGDTGGDLDRPGLPDERMPAGRASAKPGGHA